MMIIANRLIDGVVVFHTADGGWTTNIADGAVLEDEQGQQDALAKAKADEADCVVIDPYLIDVAEKEGQIRPTAIREAIRAFGPTV